MGGEFFLVDLEQDPHERSPRPLGDHPLRPYLEAIVGAIDQAKTRQPTEVDEELIEQLEALGYLR